MKRIFLVMLSLLVPIFASAKPQAASFLPCATFLHHILATHSNPLNNGLLTFSDCQSPWQQRRIRCAGPCDPGGWFHERQRLIQGRSAARGD